MNLRLSDLTTNKEVSKSEWFKINKITDNERNNIFKRFGVKCTAIKCVLTTEKGSFEVYYIKDIYNKIKHLKNIKYVSELNVISIEYDKLDHWLKIAEDCRKKLKYNLDLNVDRFIKI